MPFHPCSANGSNVLKSLVPTSIKNLDEDDFLTLVRLLSGDDGIVNTIKNGLIDSGQLLEEDALQQLGKLKKFLKTNIEESAKTAQGRGEITSILMKNVFNPHANVVGFEDTLKSPILTDKVNDLFENYKSGAMKLRDLQRFRSEVASDAINATDAFTREDSFRISNSLDSFFDELVQNPEYADIKNNLDQANVFWKSNVVPLRINAIQQHKVKHRVLINTNENLRTKKQIFKILIKDIIR